MYKQSTRCGSEMKPLKTVNRQDERGHCFTDVQLRCGLTVQRDVRSSRPYWSPTSTLRRHTLVPQCGHSHTQLASRASVARKVHKPRVQLLYARKCPRKTKARDKGLELSAYVFEFLNERKSVELIPSQRPTRASDLTPGEVREAFHSSIALLYLHSCRDRCVGSATSHRPHVDALFRQVRHVLRCPLCFQVLWAESQTTAVPISDVNSTACKHRVWSTEETAFHGDVPPHKQTAINSDARGVVVSASHCANLFGFGDDQFGGHGTIHFPVLVHLDVHTKPKL
jgi:hypothetical protein